MLLIIILGIQGKNIIDVTSKRNTLLYQEERANFEVVPVRIEEPPLSINNILDSLYSQSADFKVESFTLGEKGSYIEIELCLLSSIEEAEVIVNNIKKCSGFKDIRKYSEDALGNKKVCIVFERKIDS